MKKCPFCQSAFDDSNDFCLNDGTPLVADMASQETIILSGRTAGAQPGFSPAYGVTSQRSSGGSQWLVFGLILLLGVTAVGFGVAFFMREESERQRAAVIPPPPPSPITQTVSAPPMTPVPPPPAAPTVLPAVSWSGDWTHDKRASAFTATAEFTETAGRVDGRIAWTLARSANPQKMNKVGLTAVEFVRGTFDATTRMVKVTGYRKDDPNNLVIYDRYNLSLSADNQTLSGRSKNGTFSLRR